MINLMSNSIFAQSRMSEKIPPDKVAPDKHGTGFRA